MDDNFHSIGLPPMLFDITVLQKKPIIFLSNYSDVVISIWQVQATMASLTLASTAFILGKIENSYYGISIKNLLHLPRTNPKIDLSFWEKIICSILVPIDFGSKLIIIKKSEKRP